MSPESRPEGPGRLESWKEIAEYLGRGVTTVRRWEREEGLPVRRQKHLERSSVVAFKHEIDAWLDSRTSGLAIEEDHETGCDPASSPEPEAPPVERQTAPIPPRRNDRFWPLVTIAAGLAVLAGAAALRPSWNYVENGMARLTAGPGSEGHVSFSPDGRSYAYALDESEIVIQEKDGSPRTVWKPEGKRVCCVSWSPNGKWLAIAQTTQSAGYEIVVADTDGRPASATPPFPGGPELRWSNGSQSVIFAFRRGAEPSYIYERNLESGVTRRLTSPAPDWWGDTMAAPSPDGRYLAVVRYSTKGNGDIYLISPGSSEARRITHMENWIMGIDWVPDGKHLVFSSNTASRSGLFRVDRDGNHPPEPLDRTEGSSSFPSVVALDGNRWSVGFSSENTDSNVTLLDLSTGQFQVVSPSSRGEETPGLSTGGMLVFRSDRNSTHDLWTCPARDCQKPRRITVNPEAFVAAMPRWSPDGRRIAFVRRVNGFPSVVMVDADGLNERVLTTGFDEGAPAWSADGRTIFFRSNRSGTAQIWRVAADGTSPPQQVTGKGGVEAHASPDGRYLYYLPAPDNSALIRLSLGNGSLVPVPGLPPMIEGRWTLSGGFIYFFGPGKTAMTRRIYRFEITSGKISDIHSGPEVMGYPLGIGASTSAGLVAYSSQGPVLSDIVSVDFRPRGFFEFSRPR